MTEPAPPRLATVVIVNYNGEHLLGDCLDSLRRQTLSAEAFDVWVVDNASVDRSLDLLESGYPEVRVIRSPVNRGFAGGNNLALRLVDSPFAVLLNNDTVVEPGWLEALLRPLTDPGSERVAAATSKILLSRRFAPISFATEGFRPGGADPRELGVRILDVRLAGDSVLDGIAWERSSYGPEEAGGQRFFWTRPRGEALVPVPDDGEVVLDITWAAERAKTVLVAGQPLPVGEAPATVKLRLPADLPRVDVVNNTGGLVFSDGYGADRGYQQVDDGQFDQPEPVFTACGAAVALRMDALDEVGLFDDDFFLYYEDTDLSWRLRLAGFDVRYEPKAVLRHHHSATSREFSPAWFFHVDRNRLLMLTKNATAGLAVREVTGYLLTTAAALRRALLLRNRAALRRLHIRARVLGSYLRLLPRMLARRREIGRRAVVGRRSLERVWLVQR
jgi:GT2 family glycosyltransferase